MHFSIQRLVAAVHPLTSGVALRHTSVSSGSARAIVAAHRPQRGAGVLGLHNTAPVRTIQQWRGTTGGSWAPLVLGLPSWLCQHGRTIHTSTVLHAAGDHVRPRAMLVKVGDGPYRVLHPPPGKDITHFLGMDASTLLKAIAGDSLFANDMKGVAMGQCTVSFVTSTATVQPTAEELAHSKALEGLQTLGETAGTADGHVYVHIKLSSQADLTATVNLTETVKVGKKRVTAIAPIRNEAEFDKLLAAGNSVHLRPSTNEPIVRISTWRDAVEASQRMDGSTLTLISTAALYEDVGDLKNAVNNRSTGLESQTTHAIAHDPRLVGKYSPLSLVNDGRGVTFYYKKTKKAALQVDGLVVNTQYILANECKSSLDKLHIEGDGEGDSRVMGILERAATLEGILAAPHVYASDPPEAFAACCTASHDTTTASDPARAETTRKTVIPVASGFMVDSEAEKLCTKYGIELLKPQGQGGTYSSTSSAALAGRSQ